MQKKLITIIYFLSILILFFLSLTFPNKTVAETNFLDTFNGTGFLEDYDNNYSHVNSLNPTSTFSLLNNHIYTSGYDPFYFYTGVIKGNGCASIDFHWEGGNKWTGLLFNSTSDTWNEFQIDGRFNVWRLYYNNSSIHKYGNISINKKNINTAQVCINDNKIKGYLNDNLIVEDDYIFLNTGYFGFGSQTPTNYLDNFIININTLLTTPYFTQNADKWGSLEYDSASEWEPEVNDTSISAWGCALSSAAMILKYHGYDLLPDGTELSPSSLNDWFMAQNDNYIRNGLVNWTAINRLSLEAKDINNITEFEALDYTRVDNNNRDTLSSYIENNVPVILEIQTGKDSSHFVVATGIDGDTITINDPLGTNTTLEAYNNEFRSMRVLEPTSTNLSAIQIVIDDNVDVEVNREKGIALGSQYKHLPIENDNGEGTSGEPLNIYYLNDPDTNSYTATLTSTENQKYKVDVYLYDEFGEVKLKSFGGVLTANSNNEINISFDKENVEKSKINRKRALGLDFLENGNLLQN